MFHVRAVNTAETSSLYTEVKRNILCRMDDAGDILRFLAAKDVTVLFVTPEGVSGAFNAAADAGSLSVMSNAILLDLRKPMEAQADDLARRTRALIQAPAPNGLEQFLHDRLGVTYGRIMRLEQRDGFTP